MFLKIPKFKPLKELKGYNDKLGKGSYGDVWGSKTDKNYVYKCITFEDYIDEFNDEIENQTAAHNAIKKSKLKNLYVPKIESYSCKKFSHQKKNYFCFAKMERVYPGSWMLKSVSDSEIKLQFGFSNRGYGALSSGKKSTKLMNLLYVKKFFPGALQTLLPLMAKSLALMHFEGDVDGRDVEYLIGKCPHTDQTPKMVIIDFGVTTKLIEGSMGFMEGWNPMDSIFWGFDPNYPIGNNFHHYSALCSNFPSFVMFPKENLFFMKQYFQKAQEIWKDHKKSKKIGDAIEEMLEWYKVYIIKCIMMFGILEKQNNSLQDFFRFSYEERVNIHIKTFKNVNNFLLFYQEKAIKSYTSKNRKLLEFVINGIKFVSVEDLLDIDENTDLDEFLEVSRYFAAEIIRKNFI